MKKISNVKQLDRQAMKQIKGSGKSVTTGNTTESLALCPPDCYRFGKYCLCP